MKSCLRHLNYSLIHVIAVLIPFHNIYFLRRFAKLVTELWALGLYVLLCYWKILCKKEVWFDLGAPKGSRWAIYCTKSKKKHPKQFPGRAFHFTSQILLNIFFFPKLGTILVWTQHLQGDLMKMVLQIWALAPGLMVVRFIPSYLMLGR